ncbi:MAG TPA: hypothetical protein V6D11_32845 [Waterburya sp.]
MPSSATPDFDLSRERDRAYVQLKFLLAGRQKCESIALASSSRVNENI